MNRIWKGILGLGAASIFAVITVAAAHERQAPRGPILADVNKVLVSIGGIDGRAMGAGNLGAICVIAIERELQDAGFVVVDTRREADGELLLSGGHVTTLEGAARNIGDVLLSYAVELRDIQTGRKLFTFIDDQSEGSAADACEDMAEEVADELSDAKDDSIDEWYD